MSLNLFKINSTKKFARLLKSSDSLFFVNLQQKLSKNLLLISNDSYNANRIYNEIKLFNQDTNIELLPNNEVLAYERLSPQKDIIANRLRILNKLQSNQINILIINHTELQTRFSPQEYINSRIFILNVNSKLSINQLKSRLINSDYSLVENVYESGEFAVRGGIIDILPMGANEVVRIELFDNEIETIKLLDKKDKHLIESVEQYELIPAREFPTDIESIKLFKNNFLEYFPSNIANHHVKEFEHGFIPAGTESYIPLFFNTTCSILDYLDNAWSIIHTDNLSNELDLAWHDIQHRYNSFNYQYPCIKPQDLYYATDIIFQQLKNKDVYKINTQGELINDIKELPDLSVNNKISSPYDKLVQFKNTFKGNVVIIINGLGRLEIIRQSLAKHNINCHKINSFEEIENKNNIYLLNSSLYSGFICNNYAFITEFELYKTINRQITSRKVLKKSIDGIQDLGELQVGDYVVHINHGIGRYVGLTTQTIADINYEMLEIEYQDESKLFLPINNLHLISKYSKIDNTVISLTKLGSSAWSKTKAKVEKKIYDTAVELLELYAKRELAKGNKYNLPDLYHDFEHSFGYEATIDQLNCFNDIIKDMTNPKPMDRLICGDVGFGKTEVAMRAAFIASMNGHQVAILTPTTLLAEQHYQNFINRFNGFPINISEISRFKTKKEINETLLGLEAGTVDIVIGTHRLIQSDIKFKNLGLVIIDEEHRFGVKQKEKLKAIRANTDFLTMTATPIPRTLSMALDGIRDFSIIATPPKKRLAVNTLILNDDLASIKEAILREVRRGGQVFFLYNDVASINKMYERLMTIVPELDIAIAHGQMSENNLEQTIKDFINQRYHILLCSTIIETGIDISNANTIIIYRADKLGLAQLHQLRGRVGRSHHQAYCYLIVPEKMTTDAEQRIEAITQTSELGSGFNLALHDLEIRGAGEILGDNQSGDIKEVGLTMYTQLLKKAIKQLKNNEAIGQIELNSNSEINLGVTTIIPNNYCPEIKDRLIYYKRLAQSVNQDDIDLVYQEIIDKWGLPPIELNYLIESHYIRIKAQTVGISKIDFSSKQIVLNFIDKPIVEPNKIIALMQKLKTCKHDGKNKLYYMTNLMKIEDRISCANMILDELINE